MNPRVRLRVGHQHSQFWPILARFMGYCSPFWLLERFPRLTNTRVRLRVGHQHSQFWPILARFMGYCSPFWLLERFPRLTNTGVRLRVGHQHSQFWPILACIMDYYSAFWCLRAIFMADEPQGALTCRSSTLAVFADSCPFHGLLLIVLAPGAISTIDEH